MKNILFLVLPALLATVSEASPLLRAACLSCSTTENTNGIAKRVIESHGRNADSDAEAMTAVETAAAFPRTEDGAWLCEDQGMAKECADLGITLAKATNNKPTVTVRRHRRRRSRAAPIGDASRSPFVFFPGLTAQQIEAQLDGAEAPRWWCPTSKAWFTIWLETSMVIPGLDLCFFSNFAMDWDAATGSWRDAQGVQTRMQDYGSWKSILSFTIFKKQVPMYLELYQNLTSYGYVDGKDTFVSQYDFRQDPFHLMANGTYLQRTMDLIEKASALNGNSTVYLVGHSYGCSVARYFLQSVSQAWKDKYIRGYVSFSGPYQGAAVTVFIAMSGMFGGGHNGGVNLNATLLAETAIKLGVSNALYPFPQWDKSDEPIVGLAGQNYTVKELRSALGVVGGPTVTTQYDGNLPNYDVEPPRVTVHCINGYGMPTIYQSFFNTTSPAGQVPTQLTYIDGDTVVPRSSLNECQRWKGMQDQPVTSIEYEGMQHGVGPFVHFDVWMGLMNGQGSAGN